jgi:hypothetical protein
MPLQSAMKLFESGSQDDLAIEVCSVHLRCWNCPHLPSQSIRHVTILVAELHTMHYRAKRYIFIDFKSWLFFFLRVSVNLERFVVLFKSPSASSQSTPSSREDVHF